MSWAEVDALMDNQHFAFMDGWEQARLGAYMTAQVNSKRRLKFDDVIKFGWEEEEVDEDDTKITKEDIDRLKLQAKQFEDRWRKQQ